MDKRRLAGIARDRSGKLHLLVVGLALGVAFSASLQPSLAQDGESFSRGYNDGYAGRTPPTGVPDPSSEYGRGFRVGQDDASTDNKLQQRNLRAFERSMDLDRSSQSQNNDDE